MSAFFFGPLGAMVPLAVSAGVTPETARGTSEFVSSGGVRYVQRGRAAPRTWAVGRLHQGPDWARILGMAAHGVLPQCWLYDVAAARENMLPASMSAGSGSIVPVGGLPLGAITIGSVAQIPVLAGRLYSVSAWRAADGPMLTYRVGEEQAISVSAVRGSGVHSFVPKVDAVVVVTVTGSGVSGLRFQEGSWDGAFYAGHGTPCRVSVADPARTLQVVTDKVRSDYAVTLMEVGKAGTV